MRIRKFQEGGAPMPQEGQPMEQPMEEGQPMEQPQQAGGQEEQLVQVAQQIIEQMGPEAAMMLVDILTQMLQQGQAPQEQPVMQRMGGRLVRRN